MPDINVLVDGKPIAVPAGTNLVEAARVADTSVPVFCYHPKLKPVGMCRMCLVEAWTPKIDPATRQPVIGPDGKPELALMMNKLQPGCVTPVSEGMEIRTATEKVKFAQRGQLEFLLTSHPLDCPVCDKGGECPLQNLTMQFGPSISRFDYEDKVHKVKPYPLGDLIYLDRERCILCSRCVRFQDDVAGDPVLGFGNRGRDWEIISKSDPVFDSKFSGNTTDICPVGALTSSDFRFKARVWEVKSTPSVCHHCPVGCDITLDTRLGELMRVMPRENDFVNEIWICDKGRYGMRAMASGERLTTPLIRRNGQLQPATWDEAYALIADQLLVARDANGAASVGGMIGPSASNEDMYLFGRLLRETLGSQNLDHRAGLASDAAIDTRGAHFGVGVGTNLTALGKGTVALIFGADPEEEAPVYVLRLRGIAQRGGELIVANPYSTKLEKGGARALRYRAGADAQLALALVKALLDNNLVDSNGAGRIKNLNVLKLAIGRMSLTDLARGAGVAEDTIVAAAKSLAGAQNTIIMYGRAALTANLLTVEALAALAILTGHTGRANNGLIALTAGANARGAVDMRVTPGDGGLDARGMLDAAQQQQLKALLIVGLDPAAGGAAAASAIERVPFLAVADMFLTETASRATVVLPLAAVAERDGTFTNAERRVQRFRQAIQTTADLPAPWQAIVAIATRIQPVEADSGISNVPRGSKIRKSAPVAVVESAGWDYLVASDVADAIAASVPGYGATSYTSLGLTRAAGWGRQWDDGVYYDGTSYENSEGVGVQIASAIETGRDSYSLTIADPGQVPSDGARPLTLLTPVRAYEGGDWAKGSKLAPRLVPPHAILSQSDAARYGVAMGERVTLTSAGGSLTLPATVDATLAAGVVLVPAVSGAVLGDLVSGAATAVTLTKAE